MEQQQANDVACLLFPKSGELPSEELQASVRLALTQLVIGVEGGIRPPAHPTESASWDTLTKSGLLRDTALIDFCIARVAENRIRKTLQPCLADVRAQLPARLLHDPNPVVSESARAVLIADSLAQNFDPEALMMQIPGEILHPLAWRTVAVLSTLDDRGMAQPRDAYVKACNRMLSARNEGRSLQASAAKLAYFLPEGMWDELSDPRTAGLPMFIAGLTKKCGLGADMLYRFIDSGNIAAFLTVLRACGYGADDAAELVRCLRGDQPASVEQAGLWEGYDAVTAEASLNQCLAWSAQSAMTGGPI